MDRCTGTPTSTLGGGGGTKLFCSQALNATHANSTNKLRDAVTPFCEREGIIPVPQFILFQGNKFIRKINFVRPSIATILLRWNPKPKMIPLVKLICHPFQDFTSVEAAQATTIRIS